MGAKARGTQMQLSQTMWFFFERPNFVDLEQTPVLAHTILRKQSKLFGIKGWNEYQKHNGNDKQREQEQCQQQIKTSFQQQLGGSDQSKVLRVDP